MMHAKHCWILALCAATLLPAQTNLDLEMGEPGRLPTGWNFNAPQAGFTAAWSNEGCQQGSGCAVMNGAGELPAAVFGNLSQSFSATPYVGKRIRFRGYIRVAAGSRAITWFRVDRADGSMATIGNSPNATSTEWAPYNIELNVTEGARVIMGFLQFGTGRAWVDNATIEILGNIRTETPQGPEELSEAGLRNLTAFAKLAGYVRHFHPSDQAAVMNWDTFVVEGVRKVEGAGSAVELAARLEELTKSVAPTVRVFASSAQPPALPAELSPANRAGLSIVYLNHYGVGLNAGSLYRSTRTRTEPGASPPEGFAPPVEPLVADLVPGVKAIVPLSLYVENDATLPAGAAVRDTDVWVRNGNDRATRLAAVVIAWNVFNHFFPYFDHAGVDWDAALVTYLRRAATDKDFVEFGRTLRAFSSLLRDGHGSVSDPQQSQIPYSFAPVSWEWVDNDLIIARALPGAGTAVRAGDKVVRIDGKPVAEWSATLAGEISGATPQWIRYRLLASLAYCTDGRMTLDIEPFNAQGSIRSVPLTCGNTLQQGRSETRPAAVAELEPGIMYVDVERATDAVYFAALPRLVAAKGIIFDVRGYPTMSPAFLSHLTREPITSAKWLIPAPKRPDQIGMQFAPGTRWNIQPVAPYLEAKRVFLTDGRAISYAESVMGIIEAYKLGEIVGAATAGTNGNINPLLLPGGYNFVWTGMRVDKHDDSQHHGIGILPTVPGWRTREGIAENRDEVLARGLEVVKAP